MDDTVQNAAPQANEELANREPTSGEQQDEPGFDLLGGVGRQNENGGTAKPKAEAAAYQVLARKYRPNNFDDLVGQEAMVRTLSNAFDQGRIAHAFMLTGVRGVGKTTTARILARALNYEKSGVTGPTIHMDGEGVHDQAIMESRHVDVLEMDAASRTGIDDIREIIESVRYAPVSARYKVYIIDEVHMLSKQAFNGLLKTLEEPPPHVKFIFATTEIRKVPVTVLSRCQRFDLRRLSVDEITSLLAKIAGNEKVAIENAALKLIARAADGSARDSLSLLDRAIAQGALQGSAEGAPILETDVRDMLGLADRARIFDLFDLLMKGDIAGALSELRAQYDVGADPAVVLSDLADLTHFLTRLKLVEGAGDDLAMSETERVRGKDMAEKLPIRVLSRVWQMLLKGLTEVQGASRPISAAEMVLVRIAYASDGPGPEELMEQLKSGGAVSRPAPSGSSGSSAPSGPRAQLRTVASASESAPQPVSMPASAPVAVTARAVTLKRFEDVIGLFEGKSDFRLKSALERGVRLVRFEQGRIEISLLEGTDGNVARELADRLKRWTGEAWLVTVSKEQGAPTLREQALSREEALKEEAKADPLVKAALAAFPGAEIVEVRDGFAAQPVIAEAASTEDGEIAPDMGEFAPEDAESVFYEDLDD